jgi:serine/threonine protein kinase
LIERSLPAEFTRNAENVTRFIQEAKAASALNHPNIITVHDVGESDDGRFIVMELVSGRTLRSMVGTHTPLATVLPLFSQMARAIAAAHADGITHRDVKPENIMVREDGYVKVLDFGLALLSPVHGRDAEAAATRLTESVWCWEQSSTCRPSRRVVKPSVLQPTSTRLAWFSMS